MHNRNYISRTTEQAKESQEKEIWKKKLKYNLEYADNGKIITQPEINSIVVVEYEKGAKGKDICENCANELGKEIFEDIDQCNDAINGNTPPDKIIIGWELDIKVKPRYKQ